MLCALLVMCCSWLAAQERPQPELVRIGPGVTPPQLISKVEPEYSQQARDAAVEGTVVLETVIDDQGRPTDIQVISPLGYGLDEEAIKAVSKWRFRAGMRGGMPVHVPATVEVNFRFLTTNLDAKAERMRTEFNAALYTLNRPNAGQPAWHAAAKTMEELSSKGFPAAMLVVGHWKLTGESAPSWIAKDPAAGMALIQKSAARKYGAAMYVIALRRIKDEASPKEVETGLREMHEAAQRGSIQAQYFLAMRYEEGPAAGRDRNKAEQYYRLCAFEKIPQCQYRLGRLLTSGEKRRERDLIQGIALLELAAENGIAVARAPAAAERTLLRTDQQSAVDKLKPLLVRK